MSGSGGGGVADVVDTAGGGRLYVVGTPIGNLADLSPRAREALGRCDLIACEDTRRTGRLLDLSGLAARRLVRLDDHTERGATGWLVELMEAEGRIVGLVSDAGMPGIADPGAVLISGAIDAGVPVEVVPGPFAGVVALVGSGFSSGDSRFVFEGFLPRRSGQRSQRLSELVSETRPVVIYESPHRLVPMLEDMARVLGPDRRVSISRELTKMHEETVRGAVSEMVDLFRSTTPRGEFVIVVDGADRPSAPGPEQLLAAYEEYLSDGMSSRDAARRTSERFGVGMNAVKRLVFERP